MVQQTFNQTHIITTLTIATAIAVAGGAYACYLKNKKNKLPKQWTEVGKVKELCIYPLKSGRRREIQTAECTIHGIRIVENGVELKDRCFTVYGQNEVKTARTFPKLILIETSTNAKEEIIFTAPGQDPLVIKLPSESNPITVTMFGREHLQTYDCGDEAASWLSNYILEKPSGLRLGYSGQKYERDVLKAKVYQKFQTAYPHINESTGLYQDLSAFLFVNQASVDELSNEIGSVDIKSTNFRPTILMEGADAFSEEKWNWVRVGDVVFRNIKPCTRCVLTTIDPESGTFNKSREPLSTLINMNSLKDPEHIKAEGKIGVMGIYLSLKTFEQTQISVGDRVYMA